MSPWLKILVEISVVLYFTLLRIDTLIIIFNVGHDSGRKKMNKRSMIDQEITAKEAELQKSRANDQKYFGSTTNKNPKIIKSLDELRTLGRWPEIEKELFQLYRKRSLLQN